MFYRQMIHDHSVRVSLFFLAGCLYFAFRICTEKISNEVVAIYVVSYYVDYVFSLFPPAVPLEKKSYRDQARIFYIPANQSYKMK